MRSAHQRVCLNPDGCAWSCANPSLCKSRGTQPGPPVTVLVFDDFESEIIAQVRTALAVACNGMFGEFPLID